MMQAREENLAVQISKVSKKFKKSRLQKTLKSRFINMLSTSGADSYQVLKNVSLDIQKGEFFGIVGKNGGGKSTLLKLIAQIYRPSEGSIKVNGRLVPFIELGVGFNPELRGRENVYLNGALLGFSEREVDEFYDEIVEFAELHDFMDEKLKNFSSGMQVRLAFAVAIKADADILLIDEVLAVGDLKFQRKCFEYFRSLKRSDTTVVFVTHDMEAVREYCDRVALIKDGEVAIVDSADRVAKEYTKILSSNVEHSSGAKGRKTWGDLKATLVSPRVDIDQNTVKLTFEVESKDHLDGIVCGIRMKDAANNFLLGASTKGLGVKSPSIPDGGRSTVAWEFQNILAEGEYSFDIAVHHLDGKSVHEWWDDAVSFKVEKPQKTIYPIDPHFKVVFKKST